MAGQRVCHLHGGKSPQAVAAAERRLEVANVGAELVERMGVSVETDPGDALLALVHQAQGCVAYLRARVAQLEEVHSPAGAHEAEGGGFRGWHEAKPHILVAMYGDWSDRLAHYAALALKAGVDERRVRLAEADAERLMTAVVAALGSAGLSPAQEGAFRASLATELRRLAA